MEWLPGMSKTENYQFDIPSEAKKGDYILKFKLTDQSTDPDQTVQIGLEGPRFIFNRQFQT